MASDYEYITVAELETYTGIDYSAKDATFTNGVIEAQISLAERIVNDIKRGSYSGTIPDDVVAATYLLSKRLMNNLMIEFGYGSEGDQIIQVLDDVVIHLLSGLSSKKYDYKLITNITSRFFD